jgi:hypothetical protein
VQGFLDLMDVRMAPLDTPRNRRETPHTGNIAQLRSRKAKKTAGHIGPASMRRVGIEPTT